MDKLIKPEVRKKIKWPIVIVLVLSWIGAGAWFWGIIIQHVGYIILLILLALATHWAYNEFFASSSKD